MKGIYSCRRCGRLFRLEVDAEGGPLFAQVATHRCAVQLWRGLAPVEDCAAYGIAELVGFDEPPEEAAPIAQAEPLPVVVSSQMAGAVQRIVAERVRQVEAEGFDAASDDAYGNSELVCAAACYLLAAAEPARYALCPPTGMWPWPREWWKPAGREVSDRDLEKAGALVLAELERRARAKAKEAGRG